MALVPWGTSHSWGHFGSDIVVGQCSILSAEGIEVDASLYGCVRKSRSQRGGWNGRRKEKEKQQGGLRNVEPLPLEA